MVGFRVFDVGLLIVWLVWFFRLRDDDDDSHGDDGGGGEGPEPRPGKDGPGGDGSHDGPARPSRRRGAEPPLRQPLPSRVRRPRSPVPSHRS
jgi:hypothetical protein